jgi:hypothetical protein
MEAKFLHAEQLELAADVPDGPINPAHLRIGSPGAGTCEPCSKRREKCDVLESTPSFRPLALPSPLLLPILLLALLATGRCTGDGAQPIHALNGQFVTSECLDRQGRLWTEDAGLSVYDPALAAGSQWSQCTVSSTKGRLPDNDVYAVCIDRFSRAWLGTLNHGVVVTNGDRIFAIAAFLFGDQIAIRTTNQPTSKSES